METIVIQEFSQTKQYKIAEALKAKENAIDACLRAFFAMLENINYNPGKEQFLKILTEYYGSRSDAKEALESYLEAKKEFDKTHEAFLRSFKESD